MNIQCAEQNFEFWEGTHQIKRVWPPPGTNHSTPLKAALPSDPPFTVYLPTNEKLYLVWVYSSNCCSEEYTLCENCLFRPKREEYIMPCFFVFFWLISKKMSAILFRFVCSFFYLPYCSYKTYRWVDECIVLLLLTCLRLYGFAVSMFGGKKGRRDRNPGLKKKEKD